jgi:hypothetical protein
MSKTDQVRALREARFKRKSKPLEDAPRIRDPSPGAKEPKIKIVKPVKADVGSSRPSARRTAQDRPVPSPKAGAVALPKKRTRGRPKVQGPRPWEAAGVSRRTWYRQRKKEQKP